ncbi:formate/nitrite transporter family protein [Rhizoctonia solani]|uniref:Formate/nitrite transporter family protein n=1 Tax=Rhizoctonia solani TaxID=456999 RepID=A0A8H8PC50_9AGAM|nr:formate/nitrite transporter family protein [Rhizoctonia solani]QRW27443.1 formate/nitrite transporter family protein [Rhizoctonia solani]
MSNFQMACLVAGTVAAREAESTCRARDVREDRLADLVARVRAILYAEHHPYSYRHAAGPSELNCGNRSSNKSEGGACIVGPGTPVAEQTYLSLIDGHEVLERRKATRTQLGMKGFAAWFGHGSKSEEKANSSNFV